MSAALFSPTAGHPKALHFRSVVHTVLMPDVVQSCSKKFSNSRRDARWVVNRLLLASKSAGKGAIVGQLVGERSLDRPWPAFYRA